MKRIISAVLLSALIFCMAPCSVRAEGSALDAMKSIWLSEDQFFYQQLSPEHKAAWETDIYNALFYPDQKMGAVNMRCQALAKMIKCDNPRIFWIDWIDSKGLLRYETGSVVTYAALKLPDGKTLPQLKRAFLEGIEAAKTEITAKLSPNAGVREKAKAIHDWLCENNSYNYDQTSKHKKESDPVAFAYLAAHSAYSAIIPGDAYEPVCEGYAGAFKILCDELDVPCICVFGSAKFASLHMWNYIQGESGKWYLVDVTSDDVEKSGVAYYHNFFMITKSKAAGQAFTPDPYLGSGVNPKNGYTEGAAFTMPELAP